MSPSSWLATSAGLAGLAVALGAFGAHGLKDRVSPELLQVFETGARYHMYHALGLGMVGLLGLLRPHVAIQGPAWCLLVGTVVFSGSLYALVLTDTRWLGAITPLGGTALLIGWSWLAVSLLRAP